MSQVSVTVDGAVKYVTGPIPPNQLIEGITHTKHLAQVVDGTLTVLVEEHTTNSDVNGFQIKPVPEPATLVSTIIGLLALGAARRKQKLR